MSLRQLINSHIPFFVMEAHNGLSARIAQEAGFKAIWASGLCISASLGVRDNNEASWTQVLELVEFMRDAVDIPILLDGDTGFGNFNNFRRLVRKLGVRGISGVCIEDKVYPKTNSFLQSDAQELADPQEFAGKIRAGKDSQISDDFVIVARTEALIVGRGVADALNRAELYRQAGADAILIHSKTTAGDDVLEFLREWNRRGPVFIVPTTYYSTPVRRFTDRGVSGVIWANHLLRSCITQMQEMASIIMRDSSVEAVEPRVAPLTEVFRLQRYEELVEAEKRYLPAE